MPGAFHLAAFDEYAFDVDYSSSSALFLSVAGVQRATGRADETGKVIYGSLTIVDVLNETPNTCRFLAKGFTPTTGQRVLVALGGVANPSRLFAGTILTCRQSYDGVPTNGVYDVHCIDDTWKLGQIKVTKRYTASSATTIATDLIDTYAPDFSTTNIEAALATIDEITFTNEPLTNCLKRLADRIGGYYYVGEFEDVHFFVTNTATDPDDLTDANPPLTFSVERDLSQMVTRVLGEGGGASVLSDIDVGTTSIPVESVDYFNAIGGQFVSGPQRCDYTGLSAGGEGSLIGTGAAPSTAPVGALAAGSGVETGSHDYAYTYVTAAGESIPSPLATVAVGPVAAPTTGPAAALAVGTGMTTGNHYFAATFVTATGETTSSPISGTVATGPVTTGTIAAPASGPSAATNNTVGNAFITVKYAVTFVNASGETTAGTEVTRDFILGTANPNASGSIVNVGTGNLAAFSAFDWFMTAVNSEGEETTCGSGVGGSSSSTYDFEFTFASPATHGVSAYKFYRRADGSGDVPRLLGQTASTADTSFLDNIADNSGGALAPTTNLTYGSVSLTSIPVGPSGTTSRKVYATEPSGAQLKLLTTISNNTATTYTDTHPGNVSRLGANVPTSNTTGTTTSYNQVSLTSIPTGPPATTARKIYMTEAGGSQLKLVTTIANNSATTLTVSTADGSLGANIPVANTATANQVSLTAISVGPSGVTDRKVYRTVAAGSQLKLLTTIAGNVTTTYTDSTADASLGANVPTSDTSGLTQPTGQVLAGATTIPVASASLFPSAGWVVIGNGQQVISYTGKTGSTLTGVPASGAGAVTATVSFNSSITAAPMLTGIPSSGAGSILYAIVKGDPANLFIVENDVAAQAVLSNALGGGTGIVEEFIQDRRLTETEIRARAVAVLAQRAQVDAVVTYAIGASTNPTCRDHRSGRSIVVTLADMSVSDTFKIQSVRISNFQPALEPVFDVEASTNRFSFEDLLRLARRNDSATP